MENYVNTYYRESSRLITDNELGRLSALFGHDRGIENFRITPEGIYLEFNIYIYSPEKLTKLLNTNGFSARMEKKEGFFAKRIRSLAESNEKAFGGRTPNCCHQAG